MHISSFSIRNYRNFRSAKLKFSNGINTIIGENGSGKTNLFRALRILIDDSLPRYYRFYQTDFNRSLDSWLGHWITLSMEFDNLSVTEEAQVLAMQTAGNMDSEKEGSLAVYFRPKYQFRKEYFDYSQTPDKNKEGLDLLLEKLTIDDYETVYLCRGKADFSDDDVYKKYVGDFENIEFPDPDKREELVFGTYLPKEINIHHELSCTFIKALRDVESDLRQYANNPLINLFRDKDKTVSVEKQEEIIESVETLNNKISSLDEVKDIKQGIDSSIKDAVGTTYAPNIDIKSELPNEMDKLFQSLKLWVGDPDEEGYMGKIWELSLGGANLVYLSLKLLEYEKVKSNKIANFLLIEEPEAHIHTHIQKTLFNNVKENKTQVIISTHSTHISSVSKIESVNILCREDKKALVFQPSNKLSPDNIGRIERYLDATRSTLLFAKGVVLVEGDAELILIPGMIKQVFGLSLDEIGISLINIGSTGFKNVARLFHKDRIKKKCSILTDLDKSIVELPENPDDDTDYQKHCRNSEIKGEERKNNLNEFCSSNSYLRPFYAVNTFEVDFLLNGNSHVIVKCLDNIYSKESNQERSKKKLKGASEEQASIEMLRLANKLGKGWMALLVADQLLYNTYIPNYIIEAISFAATHIGNSSKVKAIMHRYKNILNNQDDESYVVAKSFDPKGMSDEQLIEAFIKSFDKDQLTAFLKLV